jgi:hypothetical protein
MKNGLAAKPVCESVIDFVGDGLVVRLGAM